MSFFEIIVIVCVALIVIKPERFPEMAYFLGRAASKFKYLSQKFLKQNFFYE